jgi:hypothetical protein
VHDDKVINKNNKTCTTALLPIPTASVVDIKPPNTSSPRVYVVNYVKTGRCGEHIARVDVSHTWHIQDLIDLRVDVVEVSARVELLNFDGTSLPGAYKSASAVVTKAPGGPGEDTLSLKVKDPTEFCCGDDYARVDLSFVGDFVPD